MQTNKIQKAVKAFRVRVGSALVSITNLLFTCDIKLMAKHYTNISNTMLANNGPKWTCARLKAYYNIGCKLSLKLKVDSIPYCKTDKDNIPRDMKPFLPYLMSNNINKRRACLTLLRSYTQIYCKVSKDTRSIEDLGPTKTLFQYYEAHFNKICKRYKRSVNTNIYDEGLFTTSKAGPNGHAMLNVDKDFASINDTDILQNIRNLNKEIEKVCIVKSKPEVSLISEFCPDFNEVSDDDMINNLPRSERKERMYKSMNNFIQWRVKKDPNAYTNVKTSKLSFLAEGGCKTRVIAIGDFFTQDCLKPIHRSLYRILNSLSTDGTSSHNRISNYVKDMTSKGRTVRSYDLTNATDRFPIFIQERVLSEMYGTNIGSLWRKLMVDRKFFVEDDKYVSYGVGQPMGLLSSWAAFALTHHIIIETCAAIKGYKTFNDYVLIGDDVTIFNNSVADEYEKFLITFNIEISKAKSLRSDGWSSETIPNQIYKGSEVFDLRYYEEAIKKRSLEQVSAAEIAKRIFLNGKELSPIPYDAIESSIKNYLLFPNLLRLCIERGVTKYINSPTPVQSTLSSVFGKTTADKVLALISYPMNNPPFGLDFSMWKETPGTIQEIFNEFRKEFIKIKAKGLYENELANIPDMGILGEALESSVGPDLLNLHPLFVLLRAYRDRCGSIHQGITIRGIDSESLDLIPFLVNPMIPNYIRKSHQIEKVRSSLILKTYKYLMEKEK